MKVYLVTADAQGSCDKWVSVHSSFAAADRAVDEHKKSYAGYQCIYYIDDLEVDGGWKYE